MRYGSVKATRNLVHVSVQRLGQLGLGSSDLLHDDADSRACPVAHVAKGLAGQLGTE